ncbi:hypothetical protein ACF0H5_006901 [Mactra antiquata]
MAVRSLDDLIEGLNSNCKDGKIDVPRAKELMLSYDGVGNKKDWEKYVYWDENKYTRNLVNDGEGCDGKKCYNLIALCWNYGQASTIHNHANAECLMKILSGNAREELYKTPSCCGEAKNMEKIKETMYKGNEVAHINDTMGLHRISNPSEKEGLVTLHLYFPPFSECKCFDESTSQTKVGQMTYYSKFGVKVNQESCCGGKSCCK